MNDPLTRSLPADAVLLHVGPPKTGTTAVQGAFQHAKAELAEHGVHCAGRERRAKAPLSNLLNGDGTGAWQRLVDSAVRAGDQRVWVSNEDFASVDTKIAARIVRDLGGPRVHIVYVVRPLDKLLPSQWQQRVRKSNLAPTYDDWLAEVLGDRRTAAHKHFWVRHDLAPQVAKWMGDDPSRFHFVIGREGDYDFLPHALEDLLALPRGILVPARGTNSSLTLPGAELIRQLDALVAESDVDTRWYRTEIKPMLSKHLRNRPPDPADDRIELPDWAAPRVRELNQQRAAFIRSYAGHVVGDPGDLAEHEVRTRGAEAPTSARMASATVAELLVRVLEEAPVPEPDDDMPPAVPLEEDSTSSRGVGNWLTRWRRG